MRISDKHGNAKKLFYKVVGWQNNRDYAHASISLCPVFVPREGKSYFNSWGSVTIKFQCSLFDATNELRKRAHVHPNQHPVNANAHSAEYSGWYLTDVEIAGGGNVAEQARLVEKVVSAIEKVADKYNLAYRFDGDELALWLDALERLDVVRLEKSGDYNWAPVRESKLKVA